MRHSYPIFPTFLLKYKLPTSEYLKNCKMPVVIFHGDQDQVIYYGSSLKLKAEMKTRDTLVTLQGLGHYDITDHPVYVETLKNILK